MSSPFTTQYVRAGACTETADIYSEWLSCALAPSACTENNGVYWSSQQLAEALDAPASMCLIAEQTNALLEDMCNTENLGFTEVGACLVDGNIYQCAASEAGCEDGVTYLQPGALAAQGIACLLCGLESSMDNDYSDLLPPTTADATTTGFGATTTSGFGATMPGLGENVTSTNATTVQDNDMDGTEGDGMTTATTDATTTEGFGGSWGGSAGTTTTTSATLPDEGPSFGTSATTTAGTEEYYEDQYGNDGDGLDENYDEDQDGSDDTGNDGTENELDKLKDEYNSLNEEQKMEAAAVFGIVLGVLIGCCLLLWLQRMIRRCCGTGRDGIEKHGGRHLVGDEMGHHTDDEDLEDRML